MPGDSTTGSTFLNDASAGIDLLIVFGGAFVVGVILFAAIYDCVTAVRRDQKRNLFP